MRIAPFSPADRGRILRELKRSGHWSGQRAGYRCHLNTTTTLEYGSSVRWSVVFSRHPISGVNRTVTDALDSLNVEILRYRRPARPSRKARKEAAA